MLLMFLFLLLVRLVTLSPAFVVVGVVAVAVVVAGRVVVVDDDYNRVRVVS